LPTLKEQYGYLLDSDKTPTLKDQYGYLLDEPKPRPFDEPYGPSAVQQTLEGFPTPVADRPHPQDFLDQPGNENLREAMAGPGRAVSDIAGLFTEASAATKRATDREFGEFQGAPAYPGSLGDILTHGALPPQMGGAGFGQDKNPAGVLLREAARSVGHVPSGLAGFIPGQANMLVNPEESGLSGPGEALQETGQGFPVCRCRR